MEAFSQLLGTVCNEVPFRKIVVELRKAGYHRTFKQCRDKVKVLHRQYREIMDKLQNSGAGLESDEVTVADLPWFQEMHHVLKHRAVTNPQYVTDSATSGPSSRVEGEVGEERKENDNGSMAPNPTRSRSKNPTVGDSSTPTPGDSRSATLTKRTATSTDRTATVTDRTATVNQSTATPTDKTAQPLKRNDKNG